MAYITAAEYNTFAGTSGEDALITELITITESALNSILRITTFDKGIYTEYQKTNLTGPYYLKQSNPLSITSINDLTPGDLLLEGRRLLLKDSPMIDDWGRIKFIYEAGYERTTPSDTLPQDIKSIMYHMVGGLYNDRKSVGISEWSQGQLRLKFTSEEKMTIFKQMFDALLSKYKKNDIYS